MALDFPKIVEANQSMVFSIAVRFLRDRESAEELAQDVFLQLYEQRRRIESPAHATWWLRRAISHRAIDEVRKRKLRPQICLESVPEPAARASGSDPFLRESLWKLVDTLPERARNVVVLRYEEDLDPGEISEKLDMPIGTVKSHLHRSLATLRRRWPLYAVGASLAFAALVTYQGLEARRQLLTALRITKSTLQHTQARVERSL